MKNYFLKTTKKTIPLLFSMLFLITFSKTYAQSFLRVSGTVVDNLGEPLIGVNVYKEGTKIVTTTDFDGQYTIDAQKGDSLRFSYLGFKETTQKVKGPKLDLLMEEEADALEEVVVVGYGKQKKIEVTGAVAQVKSEEIENIVTSDIASAIQGQIAGVSVTATSGEPGEGSGILIRGVSSLSGSNDPLFVVDGVPQSGDPRLNPNEIETIDVLKDAASAAIYGTRAASGVILITTKKGKEGNVKVRLNVTRGIQSITRELPLLNTPEQIFFNLRRQDQVANAARNNRFSLLNDTDLRDIVQNDNASVSRYNLNISGGTKNIKYNLTLGYFGQEGIIINSKLDRYNLRSNVQIKKNKWSFNNGFGFTIDDQESPNFRILSLSQNFNPFRSADNLSANQIQEGNEDEFGALAGVIEAVNTERDRGRYRFEGSTNIGYKFTDALSFKTLGSVVITNGFETQSRPDFQIFRNGAPQRTPLDNFVFEQRVRNISLNWNAGLNYDKKFGKNQIKALALVSLEQDSETSIGAIQRGLVLPEARRNLASTSVAPDNTSFGSLQNGTPFINQDFLIRRIGTIGRVQYNYDKRYLASISNRLDASSQFSSDNRFASFPSVSLGWNISEETFWENIKPIVNNFKFRASFGTTGNDRFPANSSVNTVRTGLDTAIGDSERLNTGFAQTRFANTDVKWEVTRETNIGIDLNFLKNKIQFTADYYSSDKEDLLISLPNVPSSGSRGSLFSERLTTVNAGNLTNKGIELALKYKGNIGKVWMNAGLTFTKNVNEVTSLGNGSNFQLFNQQIIFGDPSSRAPGLLVGREAGSFLVFKTDGIVSTAEQLAEYQVLDPSARIGDRRYVDVDGDGSILGSGDRIYGGSGLPDFETSLNLNFGYKNFSLSTNWVASIGNEVLNAGRALSQVQGRSRDLLFQFVEGLNEDTPIPAFRGGAVRSSNNFRGDIDEFIEDGSFLRLRNIHFSYNFPKKFVNKLKMTKFSLFASAQNVLTITDYTGFNPEVGGNNIQTKGLDRSVFPVSASYNLGFNLEF